MKRIKKGRALFYTRDSGGKHENTPGEYVAWAQREANRLGLSFNGTPESIEAMIRAGTSASGDIFVDYGVQGHILSREGLDVMIEEALRDPQVSHIFIPRRDRLARPNNPVDGIKLENRLRENGLTLVFMDKVCPPLPRGKRQDISELIMATVEYDRSGQDRRDLAQKIIYAQIRLAKMGFSTGGRPPYAFRRWLAKEDGTPVRELAKGERVRMPGHHVVWLPGPEEEVAVVRRILDMLETMPASRVAAALTADGVPSPDAGRYRTDNGVRHRISGVWHQSAIVNIARNPLLVAMCSYGTRSMGDQLRYTPTGPRELDDGDFRHNNKPRVIRNAEAVRTTAPAKFKPVIDPERHRKLIAKLDERSGTQRSKPRSKDPTENPLGCRAFDMNCGWPMYREPYSGSFRYKCGLYQQSHGQKCTHNHVDGLTATRFMLSCLRQRLLSPKRLRRLERRIKELADTAVADSQPLHEIAEKRVTVSKVTAELEKVTQNLARAETDEQYKAVAAVFEKLKEQRTALEVEIAAAESRAAATVDAGCEEQVAMELVHRLAELASSQDRLASAGEIFRLTNARLFLGFQPVKVKKRTLNKVIGGAVTFGDTSPPIPMYEGPTARRKIKSPTASDAAGPGDRYLPTPPDRSIGSGREGKSLGNVSRGDWTPVELFVEGANRLNPHIRSLILAV